MDAVTHFFESFMGHELVTAIIAMFPFIELRGAIPYGIFVADMSPVFVYLFTVIANCIPVPFVIFFIKKIMNWLRKYPTMNKIITKLEEKADSKAGQVTRYKYEMLGLCLFVAIPLPGTGAYSGALIAALLGFRKKHSIIAICAGVAIAGLLVTLACTVFNGALDWMLG